MALLFWITVGFIIMGFIVLVLIKRNIESKESLSSQHTVWWIAGTTVWGIVNIILLVWLLTKIL
ncbi:hypothetical protein V7112_23085 [Bacillus sp. JJ1566]|uniref:hypothetical protein n=1 Tax=Bacillus sp. JJ1566 TaxID=3122961 RepID=UPI003000AE2A